MMMFQEVAHKPYVYLFKCSYNLIIIVTLKEQTPALL